MTQTKEISTDPPVFPDSLHFSPHGEAKCVRGLSGRGARRLARAGVLEQYVEHGKQAQRSPGGRIVCFDRRVVRNAGYSNRKPRPTVLHESRNTNHGLFGTEALQPFFRSGAGSLHFSPRGEAKCVRGPSGRGASRLARAGVLEQYVEHGKQAQRSPGGRIACFGRRVVRNAG